MHFIETILCENHQYPLLSLHQKRVNHVFRDYFPFSQRLNLKELLPVPKKSKKVKTRLVYDDNNHTVSQVAYQIRPIQSLQLIEHNEIDYSYKFEDRTVLDELFSKKQSCDDILIVKNGLITDSYYANPAFWDGNEWFAPKSHLLNGIRRQHLLQSGQIREQQIGVNDLAKFEKVSLINAMIDLGELEVPIANIIAL